MELISLGKDVLQNIAEHAASYRMGQSVLRQLDRVLWVVEKCARWAVPPPLDQDERPQPELVRPLPWVFFLMMLITLRVTRESMSLVNLVMGKPPLRSADVVMFIQSKRRYLRTLKYQGNRMMRARTSLAPARESWYNRLYKLFELTMCFRRESNAYGNNNTTQVSNNEEVMVVKRSKRVQQDASAVPSTAESTMERLIEKMMLDLDAESDDDSCYTLTNATTPKSEGSDITIESEADATLRNKTLPTKQNGNPALNGDDEIHFSPTDNVTSTPEKEDLHSNHIDGKKLLPEETESENNQTNSENNQTNSENNQTNSENNQTNAIEKSSPNKELDNNVSGIPNSQIDKFRENLFLDSPNNSDYNSCEDVPSPVEKRVLSTKQISENLILTETQRSQRTLKKEHKIANGRTVKSVPNKKKGPHREKINSSEVPPARVLTSNNSF